MLLEWCGELIREGTGVDILPVKQYKLRCLKAHVWNIVGHCSCENWYDILINLILLQVRHHGGARVEATYAVVVALLVPLIAGADNWEVFLDDPRVAEFFCKFFALINTCLPDECSRIA